MASNVFRRQLEQQTNAANAQQQNGTSQRMQTRSQSRATSAGADAVGATPIRAASVSRHRSPARRDANIAGQPNPADNPLRDPLKGSCAAYLEVLSVDQLENALECLVSG